MERTYTIPLRRQWRRTVRYRRAKKTVRAIRDFFEQHMKASDVKIGKFLNEECWKHGMKNPPSYVRVNAFRDKDGTVFVELFGKPLNKPGEEKPKAAKKAVEPAHDHAKGEDHTHASPASDAKPAEAAKKAPKKAAKKEVAPVAQ